VDVSGVSGRDPVEDLDTVRRELELFRPEFAGRPQLVAANKMDAVDDESRVTALARRAKTLRLPFYRISAVAGDGLQELTEAMWRHLAASRSTLPAGENDDDPPPTPAAVRRRSGVKRQ
jgi:GTP-binding protein